MIKKSVYFIGIGGIGMSALARYYKAQGYRVAGSDIAESSITAALRKERIQVKIGHKASNIGADAGLVTYSRAIPADNPELVAAKKLGLRAIPYAEVLGELTEEYPTIAITGSHGKSTTTALVGLMLIEGGLDPTVLIGTNLKEFGGKNVRLAKNNRASRRYLVLEADDFGGAFWAYSPFISIVTNIDREHLDFYKNLAGVKKAFLRFITGTTSGGALILNRDDKNLYSLQPEITAIAKKKKLRVVWYSVTADNRANVKLNRVVRKIKKVIKIPGDHNLSNAMAAYELGKLLKIPEKKILGAIGTYRGAWRRMEYRGDLKIARKVSGYDKVVVYDDYAHHPTEIKATLQAFHEQFPHVPIICIFQPHQAKRLHALFKEFIAAFPGADVLILIPSYTVAGRDGVNSEFTSARLAAAVKKHQPKKLVFYMENPRNIKKFLNKTLFFAEKNCCYEACLVVMGAGDTVQYTDSLVK
jgi:UDP-N-acetylmuramate--alanine ligase